MGLDISKFSPEQQAILNNLDKNKDGVIDKEHDGYDEETIGALLGAMENTKAEDTYTTKPSETEPIDPTAGMTEKQAKKYKNEANEIHMDYLKAYVNDGISRQEALAGLDKRPNVDPEFRKAVADVIALMSATYDSSEDINHKELMKKLETAGIKDDLHENILKQLEKMAKNECIAAQTSAIADMYAEKIADAKKNGETKTSQQIMDEIKQEVKAADNFKGDFKEAYKHFNQPMIDAYNKVYEAIGQIDDLEKGGKVQDKAEEILKKNGQWDKYTKKALLGDRNVFKRFKSFLTGYKSDGRIASDNQGRWNRVEHKKTQTTQEIMDCLGKKTELFVALREAGFIKESGDGKWDLSELSAIIGKQVGADATLNRDAKKDTNTSEIRWTKSKLAAISQLHTELSEKDAKALVKLCGYDIEGKHWGRAIFGGILGAASGAALTGGSALAAGQLPKDIEIPYYKDKTYDISKDLQDKLGGNLPEGITIDASGNIHIITDILVSIPKLAGQLGQTALYAAVPGALVGAALGVASGLKDKGQMPEIPVNFDEMTYEEFADTINQSKAEYAPVALLIAASFVDKDGNWDREGYKNFLNEMAGDKNGIINRAELIGGLQKRLKEVENKDDNVDDNNDDNNCEDDKCPVDVKEQKGKETTETTDNTYVHFRKKNPGVGWKEMVEAYYPGLIEACGGMKNLYGKDGAIKAFQRELCTDENGNFDAAKFSALIHATDVPKEIKIPTEVKGIKRVIKKPTPAGKRTTSGTGEYRPAMDKVGRDEITSVKKVGPSTYLATDGCENSITASGSTPAEAVANLKKTTGKTYENESDYQ